MDKTIVATCRRLGRLVVSGGLLGLMMLAMACSEDEEAARDPAPSCKQLCTSAGFSDGRADVQPNEVNCFCTGGSGSVAADACASMCKGIGRAKGSVFGSGAPATANACQCS
jgi:hypothetical protein